MAHAIEVVDGIELAVFNREPAWHRLGTVLDSPMDVDQAMEAAHLKGWNVHHAELHAMTPDGFKALDSHAATCRTNPINGQIDVLGVTGKSYGIVQNEEAFAFAQNILDLSGTTVEAAGSLKGGKTVWMLLHLPQDVTLSGGDVIRPYLLVSTGHDGTTAMTVQATTIRVVCANTLQASLAGDHPTYKVRHTSNASGSISDAREALDLGWSNMEAFEAEANAWINRVVSVEESIKIMDLLAPSPDWKDVEAGKMSKAAFTRAETRRDLLWDLDRNDIAHGSAWGLLNAFTEYADHYARPLLTPEKSAASAVGLWGTTWKDNALKTIRKELILN